jgi:hypothetical protein
MAQEKTQSQRRGARRGQGVSSRAVGQSGDETRSTEKARRSTNEADREFRRYVSREEDDQAGPPDVLLDVPELKVDLIHLELDDLEAHVALKANVLNLVTLSVGVDAHLSRVKLDIKGVEAAVVLKARLDHVSAIVDRVLTSVDRNPDLVEELSRAAAEIAEGAGEAVQKTGEGAGEAVGKIGEAAKDIGAGVQGALKDVGQGGDAAGQVGKAPLGLGGPEDAQHNGLAGGPQAGAKPGSIAKEVAKIVGREIRHAASNEARDLGLAATRKVRELGERRERRRAEQRATDAALRVADELGIDLAEIDGTGREGQITVKDVREAQKL